MLKDFLNSNKRKTANWIKSFDDATVEERVILLENLEVSNEHPNAINDEIEDKLKDVVRDNFSKRCAELAIKRIKNKDFLVDLLEKDHLADFAADNLARAPLDQISGLIVSSSVIN